MSTELLLRCDYCNGVGFVNVRFDQLGWLKIRNGEGLFDTWELPDGQTIDVEKNTEARVLCPKCRPRIKTRH